MAVADVVVTGTVLTVDDAWPTAEPPVEQLRDRLTVRLRTYETSNPQMSIDAAWQLFADDVIGLLAVGKYADWVVLPVDPRSVPPEQIADLDVCATFLAGREVYRR